MMCFQLRLISDNVPPHIISVTVYANEVSFVMDAWSPDSIVPLITAHRLGWTKTVPLIKSSLALKSYSGHTMQVVGEMMLPVSGIGDKRNRAF